MNQTKFTPGPWLAEWTHKQGDIKFGWHVFDAKKVAFLIHLDGTLADEANANLIAAAPDMYEALNNIVGKFYADLNVERGTVKWLADAEAALSKANPKI